MVVSTLVVSGPAAAAWEASGLPSPKDIKDLPKLVRGGWKGLKRLFGKGKKGGVDAPKVDSVDAPAANSPNKSKAETDANTHQTEKVGQQNKQSAAETKPPSETAAPEEVYRRGSSTDNNLTPRPKDAETGLSTNVAAPPGKSQVINTKKLNELEAVQDGADHVSIRPKDKSRMNEWVDSKDSDETHEFTQELKDAIDRTEKN